MVLKDVRPIISELANIRNGIPLEEDVGRYLPDVRKNVHGEGVRCGIKKALRLIEQAPPVDAVPVVHGRWIVIDDDYGWDEEIEDEYYYVIECECSKCHERVKADRPNYCPHSGARMDGE